MMASSSIPHLFVGLLMTRNLRCHCLWSFCVTKSTKTYNYNLDDLIDWKKKTNLAFGSPRTLTKTGKLRKSKNNENEQLQTTLEQLSAQSNHFCHRDIKMNDDFIDAFDNETHIASNSCIKRDPSEADIAKELYTQPVPLHCADDKAEKSTQYADGIIQKHFSVSLKVDDYRVTQSTKNTQRHDSFHNSSNYPFRKTDPSNKITDFMEKNNDDDIQIPVISPIPSANNKIQTSYNDTIKSKALKSEKHFQPKTLPSEPPLSFQFIHEIPLFSGYSMDEDKFLKFKADVESMSLRTMPSVKSILNKTMPDLNRFFLNRWREGMIKELGEKGFKAHQDATIKRGVNFHANVLELLSGKPESEIQIMPDNEGHWASLQTAMKHITGVKALEENIEHPFLLYRGVVDCVAKYKDVLCVIDWKTSKKPRPLLKNTYDDPLQVVAYMGSVNANTESVNKFGKSNHGLLVVIYPDGSPAHIHLMNKSVCEQFWQDWLGRLYNCYQLIYTEKITTG